MRFYEAFNDGNYILFGVTFCLMNQNICVYIVSGIMLTLSLVNLLAVKLRAASCESRAASRIDSYNRTVSGAMLETFF